MTRRVAFKQAEVTRLIKGAVAAGLSPADFKIVHRDGELSLLPANAADRPSEEDDLERRMRDAFGA